MGSCARTVRFIISLPVCQFVNSIHWPNHFECARDTSTRENQINLQNKRPNGREKKNTNSKSIANRISVLSLNAQIHLEATDSVSRKAMNNRTSCRSLARMDDKSILIDLSRIRLSLFQVTMKSMAKMNVWLPSTMRSLSVQWQFVQRQNDSFTLAHCPVHSTMCTHSIEWKEGGFYFTSREWQSTKEVNFSDAAADIDIVFHDERWEISTLVARLLGSRWYFSVKNSKPTMVNGVTCRE